MLFVIIIIIITLVVVTGVFVVVFGVVRAHLKCDVCPLLLILAHGAGVSCSYNVSVILSLTLDNPAHVVGPKTV